jgi:hypothetical protein
MTNDDHHKRGKLHHSPWHSDAICTSNQLNTPPGRLSSLFHTKQYITGKRSQSNNVDLLKTNVPNHLLSDHILDVFSSSDTICVTIPESISDCYKAISAAVSESNSYHSNCCTLLKEGGLREW